jgi:hypothetical protein
MPCRDLEKVKEYQRAYAKSHPSRDRVKKHRECNKPDNSCNKPSGPEIEVEYERFD